MVRIELSVFFVFFRLGVKFFLLLIVVFRLWFFNIFFKVWNILVFMCNFFLKEFVFIGWIINFWKVIGVLLCEFLLMMFIIGIGNIYVFVFLMYL